MTVSMRRRPSVAALNSGREAWRRQCLPARPTPNPATRLHVLVKSSKSEEKQSDGDSNRKEQ